MNKHILVIEDDKVLNAGLSTILLTWGYTLSTVSNGDDAIRKFKQSNLIDIVICDIFMPQLSGPSLILHLKKIYPKQLPKIIIMSGIKDPDTFLKSIDVRYDAFISKPINFDKLKEILSTF